MASRWAKVKRIPIDEVAQRLGVSLSRRAGMQRPFPDHKDKNPSFSIDRKKNLCFCHACGRGGSVIDFASIMTGKSPSEVVSWLSQSIRQPKTNSHRFSRTAPAEVSEAEDAQFVANPAIFDHLASLTDALSAIEMGLTAIGLTGASTTFSTDLLGSMRSKTAYIIPDNDEAGMAMEARLTALFRRAGIQFVVQRVPHGNDLNDYLVWRKQK